MSEENNQKKLPKTLAKKSQKILVGLVIFLSLIFFGYFGFKYSVLQSVKKIEAQKDLQKFDNIESEIFDLSISSDDLGDAAGSPHDFSDIAVNELREKGAEFIYQMLLKNQVQIAHLDKKTQLLNDEIVKYKNQQKIAKMILTYVDLRQDIFGNKSYANNLQSFELLIAQDKNLSEKLSKLKESLEKFSSQKELQKSFSKIIPNLIIAKKDNGDGSFLSKVKSNISKLVIVRRIDGKNPQEIDAKIVKIEEYLAQENYQEAMNLLLSLEQKYHKVTHDFLNDLSAVIEVQEVDQEILNYLKSLS